MQLEVTFISRIRERETGSRKSIRRTGLQRQEKVVAHRTTTHARKPCLPEHQRECMHVLKGKSE